MLDDPTQYNDLVHATAILEVIRNLVKQAGYQVGVADCGETPRAPDAGPDRLGGHVLASTRALAATANARASLSSTGR